MSLVVSIILAIHFSLTLVTPLPRLQPPRHCTSHYFCVFRSTVSTGHSLPGQPCPDNQNTLIIIGRVAFWIVQARESCPDTPS